MASAMHSRDTRLDMLRGMALLIIFITHIPGMVFTAMTPAALGYADAADAFVLIAGMAAYHAYGRKIGEAGVLRGSLPVINRAWQLYVTHLALVVVVTGLCAYAARQFGDPNYLEAMGLDVFLADPALAVVGMTTLTFLPNYLDILPLYVVLLAFLPLVLMAVRLHWALPLVLSGALYLGAQMTGMNLPNMQASRVWFFNPFAWQLIFVIGVVVAHLSSTGALEPLFRRTRLVAAITALAAAYAMFSFLSVAPWRAIPAFANVLLIDPADLPLADKTNLSPIRLFDTLAKAWLIAVLIPRSAAWLEARPARWLSVTGRQSLPVFVLGTMLSTVGTIILRETGFALAVQATVLLGGFAALILFAMLLEWQSQGLRKEARPARSDAAPSAGLSAAPGSPAAPPLPQPLAQPSTK